jgi:O-antigen ligase
MISTVLNLANERRGQSKILRLGFLLHSTLALLFVGMSVSIAASALVAPMNADLPQYFFMAVLFLVSILAYFVQRAGSSHTFFLVDLLLVLMTLSGLPGLVMGQSQELWRSVFFVVVLGLRNYVLFVVLPRSYLFTETYAWEKAMRWVLLASFIIILGSLRTASLAGASLDSGTRLTGEGTVWLNANTTGLLTSIGILVVFMSSEVPFWLRICFGAVGGYVLLLAESRTSMLALAAALVTSLFFSLAEKRRYAAVWLMGLAAVILLAGPPLWDKMSEYERVQSIISRSTGGDKSINDPVGGRQVLFMDALNRLKESPAIGFGYLSGASRIENGYLSILLESGVLGLATYLMLLAAVVASAWRVYRKSAEPFVKNLGRYTLVLTVFICVHGFGERSHGFQGASMVSNLWLLLSGLVICKAHELKFDTAIRESLERRSG